MRFGRRPLHSSALGQVILRAVTAAADLLRALGPRYGGDLIGSAGELIERAGRSLAKDLVACHAARALVAA